MNVLYICSSVPGAGIHYNAAMLPLAMRSLGVNPVIVSAPGEADEGVRSYLLTQGLEVSDIRSFGLRGIKGLWASARELASFLERRQVDIMHPFGFGQALRCWLAWRMAYPNREPRILVSFLAVRKLLGEEWPIRVLASLFLNRIACATCVTCTLEYKKMLRAGLKADRLELVPLYIDTARFELEKRAASAVSFSFDPALEGRPVITYLAAFRKGKAHDHLLKAASTVIRDYSNALFILAGDGPLHREMQQLARRLGLSGNVLFPGKVPRQEVPALLERTTIGVVSSLSETFCWAMIEPLLANRPVVTTDVGFALDLAQAGGVLMVPKGNPTRLAEGILQLLRDPALREQVAARGRAFVVENCEINRVAERYVYLYRRYLEEV